MKHILVAFFFFLFSAVPAFAQSDWVVTDFQSTNAIQPDGTVDVTETISVDFYNLQKHGIYRDLPFVYQNANGTKTYTKIDDISVKQDGQEGELKRTSNDNNIRLRIGNPDRTISGTHIYTLHYTLSGVLRSFDTYDQLYLNVTGNDWEAPIEKASATISVPEDKLIKVACYEGVVGSTEPCTIIPQSINSVRFDSTRSLGIGEGMTIAADYTKGMVPILTVDPPKRIQDDFVTKQSLIAFLITFVGGFGLIIWGWTNHGRDFWFRTRQILDPKAKQEKMPLVAHQAIVVEFEPPEKLRPAELGVLMDEKADTLDITATLVDLANRGFLTIKELPKKWLLGSKDYEMHRTKQSAENLLPYERMLLKKLFATGETVTVSSLKATFYTSLAAVKKQLYIDVMKRNVFIAHPESIRNRYRLFAFLGIVVGFAIIILGFIFIVGPLVSGGAGIILSSIFLMIMATHMPRRTALGRELYIRTKGYQLFISGAEKYRQQFYEKKNMFNEVLPYAIVFGLTGKFAKAMKDMGIQPENPTWYSGSHVFVPIAFANDMNDFSKSLSTAIASTPSSSGTSGGSSGGGFSGGGGGSW